MKFKTIRGFLLGGAIAVFLICVLCYCAALTNLDGLRAGRTSMILSAVALHQADTSLDETEAEAEENLNTIFEAAILEAKKSVQALQLVEDTARKLDREDLEKLARHGRCLAERDESSWLTFIRYATNYMLDKKQSPSGSCKSVSPNAKQGFTV